MTHKSRALVVAVATALSSIAFPAASHEQTGGGARLGKVNFKVECNAAAQAEFNTAMAYYHSFAWEQMREPFERVLQADPGCGMAHWLRALASLNNPFTWPTMITPATLSEGGEILEKARQTGLKSQRERDYVDALATFFKDHDKLDHGKRAQALESAMEQVMQRYPDDTEAATLYALVLSANFDPNDKKYTKQLKAAAILEPIAKAQPDHPGAAHYLIHSYDYPPIAAQGLEAARRYSKIAPDAPHALHMPSHIFTRVGAWQESIEANRASAKASAAKSFDTWHAQDYMVYAHLQLGQDRAAREVVSEALGHPARIDNRAVAYAYAAMPARLALERGAWQEAAKLDLQPAPDQFPWKKYSFAEAINAYARGIGAAMSGDAAGAQAQVARLEKLRAETKVPYWVEQVAIQAEVVRGLALCAQGDRPGCLATLDKAAAREDATEKNVVTPGPLVPAREVLAYAMLKDGKAAEALRNFESVLEREPNRFRAFAGAAQAAHAAGDAKKAEHYATRVVELTKTADTQLAEVAQAKTMLGSSSAGRSK
jgi:Tfp pilus assembly protein PilF